MSQKSGPNQKGAQPTATSGSNGVAQKKRNNRRRNRNRNRNNKSATKNTQSEGQNCSEPTVELSIKPLIATNPIPRASEGEPAARKLKEAATLITSKDTVVEKPPVVKQTKESLVKIIEKPSVPSNETETNKVKEPASFTKTSPATMSSKESSSTPSKSREEIMAEREAKKLAKQAKKVTIVEANQKEENKPNAKQQPPKPASASKPQVEAAGSEKSREQIEAERKAKKLAKQAAKAGKATATPAAPTATSTAATPVAAKPEDANKTQSSSTEDITKEMKRLSLDDSAKPQAQHNPEKKKTELTKAERRAIQEAQRAAKAQALQQKAAAGKPKPADNSKAGASKKPEASAEQASSPKAATPTVIKPKENKVRLFNHLENSKSDASLFVNNATIHPSVARLGEQYAKRTIVGSNARCIAFLNALKMVIQDFETPPKKEFTRSLEVTIKNCVDHLQKCRPLAVSVTNAHKHIKHVLTQLPVDQPESDLKQTLCHFIETYIENQIGKAAQAISSSLQEKISDGDVILTFGCSSLIHFICEEAHKRKVDFRVIIVDSRPFCEGQELLRRLSAIGIPCTYVLINAVGFVMPEATKVLLGAHALLSNGYVMARTGTAQVALVARSFNVPVLVCCETHKFSERFQTDAIVYNELGNPDDLVLSEQCCLTNWKTKGSMAPLNLNYDITPPELVTAVVTEVSILPCTSVPVILRIKPTEIGY